jgi:DNA-binding transcriptional MerR regulator
MYRIKELSQITGVSSYAIRYYERMGILPEASRAENGYRAYSQDDVDRLHFLHGARQLDLPLNKIAEILALRDEGTPTCHHVRHLIEDKITEVEDRIRQLEVLREELIGLDQLGKQLRESDEGTCVCQQLLTRSTEFEGDQQA